MQSLISFGQKARTEDYYLKRSSCLDCLVLEDLYEQCNRVNYCGQNTWHKDSLLFDMGFANLIKHLCRMQHVMQLFVGLFLVFRPFKDMHSHMQRHIWKHHSKLIL
jgi:hypothetical protein